MVLRLPAYLAAALGGLAAPVCALTADEVWRNQTDWLAPLGVEVTATPVREGGITTMTAVRFAWSLPADAGRVTLGAPDVTLAEQSDGTVAISYPATFALPMRAAVTFAGAKISLSAEVAIRRDGPPILASGTADSVTYTSGTAFLDIVLDGITFGEGAGKSGPVPASVILTIWDLASTATIARTGGGFGLDGVSTTGQSVFEVSIDDPAAGRTTAAGVITAGSNDYRLEIPATPLDWLDLSAALREGLSLVATTGTAGYRTQTTTTLEGSLISDQRQMLEQSTQTIALSAGGLAISGRTVGMTSTSAGNVIFPVPFSMSVAEASAGLTLPLLADPAPQAAGVEFALKGITVSEEVWSLVDPGAVLPRDPAALAVSVRAEVINRIDLPDIMGWQGVGDTIVAGGVPVDLQSLTVTGLEVAGAGARLTGEAAFAFDNSDRTTFPGMPRPEGQASGRVVGLYGLLDRLAQSGILQADGVMAARAAIGMFAKATGADELESRLVIDPEGTVTVNGAVLPFP